MEHAVFYERLHTAATAHGAQRHKLLSALHDCVLSCYLKVLESIDHESSTQVCPDGRTLAQIASHIAEWERYTIQALGEVITGVRWPGIMRLARYVDLNGDVMDFGSVADFNAYQAAKHANWPWQRIQQVALQAALGLRALVANENLLSAARLDSTDPYQYELADGSRPVVPASWYWWMVSLEHCGGEHTGDFSLAAYRRPLPA